MKPRLDKSQRLLHRFYEPLQLLWMLNPARSPTRCIIGPGQHEHDFTALWMDFLDTLSMFCDCQGRGESVSAIAVEAIPAGNRFVLASKHKTSMQRLESVLGLLTSIPGMTSEEQTEISRRLTRDAIGASRQKVKVYCGMLARAIKTREPAASMDGGVTLPDTFLEPVPTDLIELLQHISVLGNDPYINCESACSLSMEQIQILERLQNQAQTSEKQNRWSDIRHAIGRLKSWHIGAKVLVRFAHRYAAVLHNCRAESIPLPGPIFMPDVDDHTTLKRALGRMFPADQQDRATEMYEGLIGLRDFDFEEAFIKNYEGITRGGSRMKLEVHAEVFLMEYFHSHHLVMVDNFRYIGCSKPSCHCCTLYTRYHPGQFEVRPSHGTAWATWCPPLQALLKMVNSPELEKHHLNIMNQVIAHLRRDLIIDVRYRVPRRDRRPDSTSGAFTRALSQIE